MQSRLVKDSLVQDMLSTSVHQQLAQRLYDAYQNHSALSPLSDEFPQLETTDSYTIQSLLVGLIVKRSTRAAEGFKLGFTSAAMREQMKVAEANYGFLLPGSRVQSSAVFSDFIHPRIEPEIAVVTALELSGHVSLAEVSAATNYCCASMEIVDSRFLDYRFKAVDNVADNSSAAAYCLGKKFSLSKIESPEQMRCRFFKNDELIAEGLGSDAMGGPLQAVQWLTHKLANNGQSLPAGSVVMTGGLSRAELAEPGDQFRVEFSDIPGELELSFI